MASPWGGPYFFSLWYPVAGLRLALLWHYGARWTPVIIGDELLIQLLSGVIMPGDPGFLNQAGSVARAPLAYGVMVALVRWMEQRGTSDLAIAPMPFSLAAVLSPTLAAFSAGIWEWTYPSFTLTSVPLQTTVAAFLVGDLLGVLIVAPPLLWIGSRLGGAETSDRIALPSPKRISEAILIFSFGWLLAVLLDEANPEVCLTPVLVTTIWIGLRCGRGGAWAGIAVCAAIILPWSAPMESTSMRFALHMGLAAVAISTYLAGSFADAQQRARRDIARRDRMLFQAERLKTLRAMSLAVIHEISQPLSTLAIESRHLVRIATNPAADLTEIAASAELIDRKANTLTTMVRRLRRYGGRVVDEPSPLSLGRLMEDVVKLASGEARALSCHIQSSIENGEIFVMGQEVELTQALLNLLRNALAASSGGAVTIDVHMSNEQAAVRISNAVKGDRRDYPGMGIGGLVARTIIEAHGGHLAREDAGRGMVVHLLHLPLVEVLHG
jgi:glucose-6-phosphate-specific signal transduction histidine kinase